MHIILYELYVVQFNRRLMSKVCAVPLCAAGPRETHNFCDVSFQQKCILPCDSIIKNAATGVNRSPFYTHAVRISVVQACGL